MATEASKFKIGLFVTIGLIIAAAALISLGALRFFTSTKTYVTYFEESVQGLDVGSVVRYLGVPVGRVSEIGISPDGSMAQVVFQIDTKVEINPDTRVQMRLAGLTGVQYLELQPTPKGPPKPILQLGFRPPHPVVPSVPSETQEFLTAAQQFLAQLNELDLKGIADTLDESLKSLNTLFASKQWEKVLLNVQETTAYLRDSTRRIDSALREPQVRESLRNVSETLSSLNELSTRLRGELNEMDLGERVKTSSEKLDRLLEEGTLTAEALRSLLSREEGNLFALLENLRRATESFNNLAISLRDNPSQLLFSKPPESTP
ncbi:MAG: MlaD family protein [bacterium]